ncbi:hypothetical protein [Nocardia amamiensis]|uniref:hypothetical protein n=1 Tax=Nocardia amamiensis TaxID=404578 RepID=UPI00082F1842|nr:hypothetical protein [Nocardia amamiensis]
MSDRSVEDELIAEARKFGHSLTHMLRLHAQATNWFERRKVRKQISLALREQRRAEQTAREHHLTWTQEMIDRYRAHALAVAERAHNPSVDHERRYRDAQSLNRHANDLRARIVANDRLTKTEQGIALDGLDAATTFPQFEPGRLFDKAHKVRGIDALRYRAQVARSIREQQTHNPQREQRRAETPEQAETIQQIRRAELAGRRELDEHVRGVDRTDPPSEQPRRDHDRLAEVERQLNDVIADRDRLGSRVGMLQRGLDSVTADRDEMRRKLDSAEGHIEALKNRNLRLAAEIRELRDQSGIQQITAERDQLKRERDEAVQKLVQATPEHQRYGSGRRRAAANGNHTGPELTAEQFQEAMRQGSDAVRRDAVGKRASFLTELRDLAASDQGKHLGERFRDWAQSATDGELLAYAEKHGAVPRDPSQPRLDPVEESFDAVRDENRRQRSDQAQAGADTQSWPRPERNGHGRNGIERSR